MHSFSRYQALLLFLALSAAVFAEGTTKTIREELKDMLAEQGLREGIDKSTRSIVSIGVSWSEKEPELVARAVAAGRISSQLNGGTLSAFRESSESQGGVEVSSVVKRVTEGYVIGVREVARVTRRNADGRLAVGIALRWTMRQEMDSAKALSMRVSEERELENELNAVAHIERMAGPHVWIDGESANTRLLGIGVAEIKTSNPRDVRTAIRLAQIKARRYLAFHFYQYDKDVDILRKKQTEKDDMHNGASDLDSLHIVKGKGVIAPGYGIVDVGEKFITEKGRRYAVCITGISKL